VHQVVVVLNKHWTLKAERVAGAGRAPAGLLQHLLPFSDAPILRPPASPDPSIARDECPPLPSAALFEY
jgi:hypothetical protein